MTESDQGLTPTQPRPVLGTESEEARIFSSSDRARRWLDSNAVSGTPTPGGYFLTFRAGVADASLTALLEEAIAHGARQGAVDVCTAVNNVLLEVRRELEQADADAIRARSAK